jgi:TonB-linked SusC/RagA family outer membrane protein
MNYFSLSWHYDTKMLRLKQILKIMRIASFMLFFCTTLIFAENSYAQKARVTIKQRDVKLETVLNEIENQTDYLFLYNGNQIDASKKVTVHVKNMPVNELLTELFSTSTVKYVMEGTHIVLLADESVVANAVFRQTLTIKGTVIDAEGMPLPGVNVIVKGTITGVVTDGSGNYSINVPNEQAVLQFSFVGFATQETIVSGQRIVNITLSEDTQLIDEVVVVGYGVQKRASVTGSVASIQSKDIAAVNVPSVSNAIVGKLPGLRAIQRSGAPGDDVSNIDIRGYGSALVIVDGVQRSFTQINANDIESISILKDASAAVYGFKGANGVILVTTKKGTQGKPQINYSGYYGIQNVTRYPEFFNAYEYALLQNEAQLNIGGNPQFSDEALQKYKAGNDPDYPNTNWWGEVTKKNAPQLYQNISISGGNENVNYFVSLGYTNQKGLWVSRDHTFEKYNVRSNINAKITQGLTVDFQLAGRLDNRNKEYTRDPIGRTVMIAHPNIPIYANNTEPYWQDAGGEPNPLQSTYKDEIGYDNRERREFAGSLGLNWEIPWIDGLTAKALLSYDYDSNFAKNWYKEQYNYVYNATTEEYEKKTWHSLSTMNERYERGFRPNQQYSLNYQKGFGLHDINVLALFEIRRDRGDWFSSYREFTVGAIDQAKAGDKTNMSNDGNASEYRSAGLVGRANYAYAGKYLAEVSFRYDGSSKFRSSEQWGFFPAISLGWRISEESFIKNNLPFVSNFKIRGSYGITGDDSDFNSDVFRTGYNYPSGSYILGTSGISNGVVDKGVPNRVLTWYDVKTTNIGFEGTFWKGLLSVEFDYFVRVRDGLPATRNLSLPSTSGLSMPQENLNSDKNKGFEIVVGHRKHFGDFNYEVKANFTNARIYNEYLERAASSNMYTNWHDNYNDRYKSITWGYKAVGQFQSFQEILNSPIQDNNGNKSLLPGDIKYQDFNNDGIIDDSDTQPIGHSTMPSMFYGLNMYFEYKGIDLTVFFQGAAGHELKTNEVFLYPFIQQGLGNGVVIWLDRWHRADPNNPDSEWIAGTMPAVRPAGFEGNNRMSTWSLLKQDYLRLKNIELGYTLPKNWLQRIGIDNVRVYVSAFNLLTFTHGGMMKYMDPENDNDNLQYYPQMKSANFGLTLSF